MEILTLILTCISLVLNIISDIIYIKSNKKLEKNINDSKLEIKCVTTETKFWKIKRE